MLPRFPGEKTCRGAKKLSFGAESGGLIKIASLSLSEVERGSKVKKGVRLSLAFSPFLGLGLMMRGTARGGNQ